MAYGHMAYEVMAYGHMGTWTLGNAMGKGKDSQKKIIIHCAYMRHPVEFFLSPIATLPHSLHQAW